GRPRMDDSFDEGAVERADAQSEREGGQDPSLPPPRRPLAGWRLKEPVDAYAGERSVGPSDGEASHRVISAIAIESEAARNHLRQAERHVELSSGGERGRAAK